MKPNVGDPPNPEKYKSRRILKRFLRRLPRRATIHRYPVLKWFPKAIYKRSYLWSFKTSEVTPALYAGWILALLPLYGTQMPLALLLALLLRSNLPVLVGLQLLTNPLTAGPIYFLTYQSGDFMLSTIGVELPHGDTTEMPDHTEFNWSFFQKFARFFICAGVGGLVAGLIGGFLSARLYQALFQRRKNHSKARTPRNTTP